MGAHKSVTQNITGGPAIGTILRQRHIEFERVRREGFSSDSCVENALKLELTRVPSTSASTNDTSATMEEIISRERSVV